MVKFGDWRRPCRQGAELQYPAAGSWASGKTSAPYGIAKRLAVNADCGQAGSSPTGRQLLANVPIASPWLSCWSSVSEWLNGHTLTSPFYLRSGVQCRLLPNRSYKETSAYLIRCVVCVVLLFVAMLSDASADEENLAAVQEAISAQVFLKEMQLLGRRHPPGKTKLEQEDTRAALRAEIQKRFEDRVLEYKVRIVSVDWRNGVAKIRTSSPLPRHKESRRIPFQISFPYPLSIPMSREQAMAIDTRKPLSFSGRLKFESKRHGFIARPPSSQMLFVVRSKYYSSVTPICTFITDKYLIRIGDDELFTKQPELTELP